MRVFSRILLATFFVYSTVTYGQGSPVESKTIKIKDMMVTGVNTKLQMFFNKSDNGIPLFDVVLDTLNPKYSMEIFNMCHKMALLAYSTNVPIEFSWLRRESESGDKYLVSCALTK